VSAAAADGTPLETIEALRRLLREGCEALAEGDPLASSLLERTFLVGRTKQTSVAMELNLSYGSYRRHLDLAIRRLAEWLWLREEGARAAADAA
jgi:hypothetical protein